MEAKDFEREDRYAVIKYKKLTAQQWTQVPKLLEKFDSARVDCVVVEKDWPEYRLVWAMLEHRMAGNPVPDFNLWRQADALQQRLTVAERRADELEGLLRECQPALDKAGYSTWQIDEALKPAEEFEALGTRPVGCCCPPKGHTGIWAAAMCPVHFGLKRPGVSHDQ